MNNAFCFSINKLNCQKNCFKKRSNLKKSKNIKKEKGNKNNNKGNNTYSNLLLHKNNLTTRNIYSKSIEKYLHTSEENQLNIKPIENKKNININNLIKKDEKLIFTLKSLNLNQLINKFLNNCINFNDLFLLTKQDMNEMKLSTSIQEKLINFSNDFITYAKKFTMEELQNYFNLKRQYDFDKEYNLFNSLNKKSILSPKLKKNESLKLIEGISIITNKDENENNLSKDMLMRESSAKNIITSIKEYNNKNKKENTKFSTNQNSLEETEKNINCNQFDCEININEINNFEYKERRLNNIQKVKNLKENNNIKKISTSDNKNYLNRNYFSFRPVSPFKNDKSIGNDINKRKKNKKIKNMKKTFQTKFKDSNELIEHSQNILSEINRYQLSYEEMRKRSNERSNKIQTILSNLSPLNKYINKIDFSIQNSYNTKEIKSNGPINNYIDYSDTKLNQKYIKISSELSLSDNFEKEFESLKKNINNNNKSSYYKNDLIGIKITNQPKIIKDSKNLFETYKNLIPHKTFKYNY